MYFNHLKVIQYKFFWVIVPYCGYTLKLHYDWSKIILLELYVRWLRRMRSPNTSKAYQSWCTVTINCSVAFMIECDSVLWFMIDVISKLMSTLVNLLCRYTQVDAFIYVFTKTDRMFNRINFICFRVPEQIADTKFCETSSHCRYFFKYLLHLLSRLSKSDSNDINTK